MQMKLAASCLLVCSLAASRHIALFGPSQAGKSSFINTISRSELAAVGAGAGLSVTQECQEYCLWDSMLFPGETIHIIDVPGFGDNFSGTTDYAILEMIRDSVTKTLQANLLETSTEQKSTIDGIILFEPLDNDSCRLHRTFELAKLLFGDSVFNSAVLLFSKFDISWLSGRQADPSIGAAFGLKSFCWQRNYVTEEVLRVKVLELRSLLSKLAPYAIAGMDMVLQNLCERARLAYETQVVPQITCKVTVTKKIAEPGFRTEVKESLAWEPTSIPYTYNAVENEFTPLGMQYFSQAHELWRQSRLVADRNSPEFHRLNNEGWRLNSLANKNSVDVTVTRKSSRLGPPRQIVKRENVRVPTTFFVDKQVEEEVVTDGPKREISEFEPEARKALCKEIRDSLLH